MIRVKKNKHYKFNNNQAKSYVIGFSTFLILFLGILISPFIFGKNYSYPEVVENEYQTINNTIRMSLVKKEYNPEEKLFRLDFAIKESAQITALPNVKYEVQSRFVENQKKALETEIKKVNDNYFVVLVKGVPEGYEVLSTTITPSYIHPELQTTNDLENKSLKIYVNESEKIVNLDLQEQEEKQYEKEYLTFKQEELKAEIELSEKEIDTKTLAIVELKNLIKKLEGEINYQTEEEKFETTNTINKHQTTINKYENEITTIKNVIEEYNNRIKNLEERKNNN